MLEQCAANDEMVVVTVAKTMFSHHMFEHGVITVAFRSPSKITLSPLESLSWTALYYSLLIEKLPFPVHRKSVQHFTIELFVIMDQNLAINTLSDIST